MRQMPNLQTTSITIRSFCDNDHTAVMQIMNMHKSDAHSWLAWNIANERQLATLNQPPYGERAIVHNATGTVVGAIGFVPCIDQFGKVGIGSNDDGMSHAEVGMFWHVLDEWRNQGIATAAATLLRDYACNQLGLRRIIATTEYDNHASQAVMRHIGMELRSNPTETPPWLQIVGVYEPARVIEYFADGTFLRSIKLDDLPEMLVLWRAAALQISPTDSEQGLRRHLALSGNLAWVLCDSAGQIIGTLLGSDDGRRGWINHLAIHPDAQGHGYGQRLITAVTTRLKSQGCEKVNLLVRQTNQHVVPFYEKIGFAVDANIFMSKWLNGDA
ncbi:MAG: GNAT family N-acetyltransferase [Roseiflexaceae bacterium]